MIVYTDIYSFNVIDEIKNGADVFMVDRLVPFVHSTNEMNAGDLIRCIYSEEKDDMLFIK